MPGLLTTQFAAAMAQSGPFGAKPRFAVGVSGGADSTALALLAHNWASERGGGIIALIVDHGLRCESQAEASLTRQRLEARGIPSQIITLTGLGGTKLQERARLARHAALAVAARKAGALFLLLGHHSADQSETVAMRAARSDRGLEGMASWTARNDVIILRPLLITVPSLLKGFLHLERMLWVEDPSNDDKKFERVRVRQNSIPANPRNPALRQHLEAQTASFLACNTILRPEGFAVIQTNWAPPAALAALLRTIGGAQYSPNREAVEKLAAKLQPATLGGVRLLKAGKFGPGWLLVREAACCTHSISVRTGAIWDGRFRLLEDDVEGVCVAAAGNTPIFRNARTLPAAVLAGLPCIDDARAPNAKPRLAKAFFVPRAPVAGLPFVALEPRNFA